MSTTRRSRLFLHLVLLAIAAALPAAPKPFDVLKPGTPKTGVIMFVSKSQLANLHAHVTLPKGYAAPENAKQRYGVIVLLHGAGGDFRVWAEIAKLQFLSDTYKRIIVSPSAGLFSWYVDRDGAIRNRGETIIVKEVIPLVDQHYRTRAKENDRWITGFSMGGYGGLRLGLKYPKLFSAVGGLSPCIKPSQWGDNWGLDKAMGKPAARAAYDLFGDKQLKQLKGRRGLSISLLCGKQDFFYDEVHAVHKSLSKAGITHHWQNLDGRHNAKFWRQSLLLQLGYFSKRAKELTRAGVVEKAE